MLTKIYRLLKFFLHFLFNSKYYTCITFNKDIFNYGNRKSDSIWVQIESLLAEKQGFEPWLRSSRTTPLAGEPLRPLGYFSLNRKRIIKDA